MDAKPVYDSRWQYWSLVIAIYTALVAMGVVENARSVSFPIIKDYYSVSYDAYGFFSSCLSLSYILFCFIASLVAERVGYRILFIISYVLLISGCLLTYFTKSFVSVACCLFVVWMGMGFFEIGSNSSSTIVFVENKGTMMSLMHFFFGLGAVIGPNIARLAVQFLQNGYYSIYLALGVTVLVIFILAVSLPFKLPRSSGSGSGNGNGNGGEEESKPTMTVMQTLRDPSVWLCSLTMGMMQTVESSGAQWAPLYLVDVLGLDVNTDVPNFTTLTYIIFTVSRLISGPMIDRAGYYCYLYICLIACFILLAIGFCLGTNGIYLFAMSGFFYSATWPIFICVIMGYYKEDAPTVTSTVIVLQGVLMLPLSTILGWVNEHWGKHWAYQLTLLFCVIGAILLTCVYYSQKRREQREKEEKESKEEKKKKKKMEKEGVMIEMKSVNDNDNDNKEEKEEKGKEKENEQSSTTLSTTTSTTTVDMNMNMNMNNTNETNPSQLVE